MFNDQSLDGKYASIWNSRYSEGYGSGVVASGPISSYDSLKNQVISRINLIANSAKAEVSAYMSSEYKGSTSDEEPTSGPGDQVERVSGVGSTSHPYYYGIHGIGAVKNPYYYGSNVRGYYPSMSYAPLTEQRPGGIPTPHGAVGATNIGPIDIDPFYVEKITLKKRR